MSGRYLIAADPKESLNPKFDLGVCVSRELLRRGISVDYLDLLSTDANLPPEKYLAELPVREILAADGSRADFWRLGDERRTAARDYSAILQRKDPPVDEIFINFCKKFQELPESVIQINRPPATYELSEHTLHLKFPEYSAPTAVCESSGEFIHAFRGFGCKAVCKPLNTYCGIGVVSFENNAPDSDLLRYWNEWGGKGATIQPYLKEIERSGDLRVLMINDHILGSVLRIPKPGSWIANLHQNGRPAAMTPSRRQMEACRTAAAELNKLGIHLIGFDFIGEFLTEINITSPTLIVQINQVMNKRADIELVDELERMKK